MTWTLNLGDLSAIVTATCVITAFLISMRKDIDQIKKDVDGLGEVIGTKRAKGRRKAD